LLSGLHRLFTIADEHLLINKYNRAFQKSVFFQDEAAVIILAEVLFVEAHGAVFSGASAEEVFVGASFRFDGIELLPGHWLGFNILELKTRAIIQFPDDALAGIASREVIDLFHILLLLFAKANIRIHPASSTTAVSKKYGMAHIPESELIINPEGRIYHLALHPDELANTVITVGDPGRVERVSRHFDRIDIKVTKREFITHTGWLGNKRITVISTGIGPDNIDIVLNELDALVNIDFQTRQPKQRHTALDIIRIGTTGGLQPDLPVDQYVISRYGVGLDNLLHFYEYQPTMPEAELYDDLRDFMQHSGKLPAEPYIFEASGALATAIARDDLQQGITLTCPGFYAPQGRVLRAKSRLALETLRQFSTFRHKGYSITNFEMETAAIFGLARILGHRALSCNAVLANRLDNTFSKEPKKTVDALIKVVLERMVTL